MLLTRDMSENMSASGMRDIFSLFLRDDRKKNLDYKVIIVTAVIVAVVHGTTNYDISIHGSWFEFINFLLCCAFFRLHSEMKTQTVQFASSIVWR